MRMFPAKLKQVIHMPILPPGTTALVTSINLHSPTSSGVKIPGVLLNAKVKGMLIKLVRYRFTARGSSKEVHIANTYMK